MAALPLLAAGAAGLVLSPPLMHPSPPRGVIAARGGPALALAETASSQNPGRPLTVAIAGGGVGGLTTALAMLKAGFDVTVYEKTGQFARFGGPIQFASNALSALKAIDERLFERVIADFTFTGTRRCGIKDGLRADGSFRMTPVADPRFLFDPSTPADWYLEFPLKACADFFDLPYTGVIDRPDLQDILLDECRAIKPDFIVNGAPVASYTQTEAGVVATLSDGRCRRRQLSLPRLRLPPSLPSAPPLPSLPPRGSVAEADVLVGSDGIWSTVRAQMYGEGEVRQTAADGLTRQGCPYSGYTVFAGEFVPERGTADFADYFECGYKVRAPGPRGGARTNATHHPRSPPRSPGTGVHRSAKVLCDFGRRGRARRGPCLLGAVARLRRGGLLSRGCRRVQWYSFLCKPPGTKRAGDSWEGGASTGAQGSRREPEPSRPPLSPSPLARPSRPPPRPPPRCPPPAA